MEVKENKLIRVAGYGRVSTDSMDQKNSLEHQKLVLREIIRIILNIYIMKNTYILIEVLVVQS